MCDDIQTHRVVAKHSAHTQSRCNTTWVVVHNTASTTLRVLAWIKRRLVVYQHRVEKLQGMREEARRQAEAQCQVLAQELAGKERELGRVADFLGQLAQDAPDR